MKWSLWKEITNTGSPLLSTIQALHIILFYPISCLNSTFVFTWDVFLCLKSKYSQQSLLPWCKVAGLASSSTGQPASKQAGAGPGGGLLGNAWLLSLSFVVSFHFHYVHLLSWSHRSNDDNSAITHCENSLHSTWSFPHVRIQREKFCINPSYFF